VDWRTLLTIGGIILFVIVMMRGCGGMMGGRRGMGRGCGMGPRPRRPDTKDDKAEAGSPPELNRP
jgi:hypothetical protein